MQTRLILRIGALFISVGVILVVGMVGLGKLNPTTIIVAQISIADNRPRIALIDTQRSTRVYRDYPVGEWRIDSFSDDGQWVFQQPNQERLLAWNIITGQVNRLPERYGACSAQILFRLETTIVFSCGVPGEGPLPPSGLYHIFNFRTGDVQTIPNNNLLGRGNVLRVISPNRDTIASVTINSGLILLNLDNGEFQQVSQENQQFSNALWFPDGQAILAVGDTTLERYDLQTQSWQTLFVNEAIGNSNITISPNGEWMSLISDDDPPIIQTIHVPTLTLTTIHSQDYSLGNAVWIGWSPDNQYMLIRVAPYDSKESNRYYLVRPDNSFITPLAQNLTVDPIWSPDNHLVSYYTNPMDERASPYLYVMDMAQYLADGIHPQPIISYGTGVQWSPDGEAIAFIRYYPDKRKRTLGFYDLNGDLRLLTYKNENTISFTFLP